MALPTSQQDLLPFCIWARVGQHHSNPTPGLEPLHIHHVITSSHSLGPALLHHTVQPVVLDQKGPVKVQKRPAPQIKHAAQFTAVM